MRQERHQQCQIRLHRHLCTRWGRRMRLVHRFRRCNHCPSHRRFQGPKDWFVGFGHHSLFPHQKARVDSCLQSRRCPCRKCTKHQLRSCSQGRYEHHRRCNLSPFQPPPQEPCLHNHLHRCLFHRVKARSVRFPERFPQTSHCNRHCWSHSHWVGYNSRLILSDPRIRRHLHLCRRFVVQ